MCWDADEDGEAVRSQLVPLSKATIDAQQSAAKWQQIPDTNGSGTHEVSFMSALPPLGWSVYTFTPQKPSAARSSASGASSSSVMLAGPWTERELEAHPMGQAAQVDVVIDLEGGMRAIVSRHTGELQVSSSAQDTFQTGV